VAIRNRRIPVAYIDRLAEHIRELWKEDIIEESYSEFCSPLIPVKKKDGSIRMALDLRKLNEITVKDSFPMPRIDEILEKVAKARVFSRLDLTKGYYQICVARKDRKKTAFQFQGKLYQFKRMPFGLCNAPQTFQRLMRKILGDLAFVQCYLDDIIIFSQDGEQHQRHLEEVFKRVRRANLRLNPDKCMFGSNEVEFLGYRIKDGKLCPNNEKCDIIRNFPRPQNQRTLKGFLGFVNFLRELIPDFAQLAQPLFDAANKKRLVWSDECEKNFVQLKQKLSASPTVYLPDVNRPFRLTTDASDFAMGAVLYQVVDGEKRINEFLSKTFSATEKRYATIEKEATAILVALEKWRHFLLGSEITIETDHKPLHWLLTKKDCPGKLGRMALRLQEFNIKDIEYIKGEDNIVADALSRIEIALVSAVPSRASPSLEERLSKDPNRFKRIEGRIWLIENESKRLCIESADEKKAILHQIHDLNGHLGVYKCLEEIRRRFYWPNWSGDVKSHLKKCFSCATKKDDIEPYKEEMLVQQSFEVFERVHLDICGRLTESHGHKFIIVLQDAYSKWIEAANLKDTTTKTIIKWLEETVFRRFGCPQKITSDCASYFESGEFKRYCEDHNIEHHLATTYHHQGNGLAEKAIQSIEKMVRTSIEAQADWSLALAQGIESYNMARHHTTGVSPFSLMFNRHPRRKVDLDFKLEVPHLDEEWNKSIASVNAKRNQARMKQYYDRNVKKSQFELNDTVLWHVMEQGVGKSKKLNKRWQGPFRIEEIHRPMAILSDKIGRTRKVHLNHVKLYKNRIPLAEFRFRGRPPNLGGRSSR